MTKNITAWLIQGERGISSNTMAAIALGQKPPDRWGHHPLDPADLNRCIKLVDDAPEVKKAFPNIAKLSPQWCAIIKNWDVLRRMFINEVGYNWETGRRAPKTYELMQKLLTTVTKKETNL